MYIFSQIHFLCIREAISNQACGTPYPSVEFLIKRLKTFINDKLSLINEIESLKKVFYESGPVVNEAGFQFHNDLKKIRWFVKTFCIEYNKKNETSLTYKEKQHDWGYEYLITKGGT